MAEASSTYPVPPAFYTLYDRKSAVAPPVPPKPVEGTYAVFGISTSSQPALPSLQGQALFETAADGSIDVKGNLARLNKGLLVAVEKLIEVLESSPSQYARALEAVLAHLNNMTHLSNMLRPVQARSTLRHMLTSSAEQKRAAIAELRANRENVVSQCTDTALALSSQNF